MFLTTRVGRYRWLVTATMLGLMPGAARPADSACREPAAICESAARGSLALVTGGTPSLIVADEADLAGVLRAARDLQADISAVAGKPAQFTTGSATGTAIIVGTLGHSARVDRIVRERHVDVSGVAGKWEAYLLQVVEKPEPGVERALLIAGADKRGTIFGIYELSRRMGVSPWQWWADVPVPRKNNVYVARGRFTDAPVVRYRGIFLNDENPALGGWMKEKFGGPNHLFYEHVFELILRLKGNALWPAMWGRAFGDDDPENQRIADLYGVVMGTSHHEPLMRADVEWDRYGKGPWDYTENADVLQDFWRKGMERKGDYESLVTIGMRGDGDLPMTQGTAIELLERIVADQRKIITEVTGKPAEQTPQVWALYKEVQDYYDQGMRVPDDVTLLFSDDNWGNLRRLPEPGAKPRAGGYGIYYHFDYVGGPRNYKWINTVQIEHTWEQMRLAHAYGADRLWIVNVGDLKPLEFPISFFLDYAWNPDAIGVNELQRYPAKWAAEQFGPKYADEIGELLTRYSQYNARRKPELLSPDTFSLVNFNEAERVLAGWDKLAADAQRVGKALGPGYRDAWYQLAEYPVLASANLNALYIAAARNRMFAEQGSMSANAEADKVREMFARDAELARVYEEDIAGGKWPHMMSQTHIGYTSWQEPPQNRMPAVTRVEVPSGDSDEDVELPDIPVCAAVELNPATGFKEIDGIIAIEAEHYSRAVKQAGLHWETIPDLGRTLSGVTTVPVTAPPGKPGGKGMRLEYSISMQQAGEVAVRVVTSPTLDVWKRGGMRLAVSIDDGEPQLIAIKADPTTGSPDFRAWERAVSDSVYVGTAKVHVEAGAQTLKLWRVDPGVVIQRVEIVRGDLPASYLGPPEIPRIGN